jgi:DNA-binding CsgD family transcriptional regulator
MGRCPHNHTTGARMCWDHTGDHMAARSAFLKLISSDPTGDALMQAFARGPMAIYSPQSAAVYQVNSKRSELVLAGSYGFTNRIGDYTSVPVSWDLPVTRAFHTGQVIVVPTQEVDERFPLLSPWQDLVLEGTDTSTPSTIVAMPIAYSATTIGVCALVCTHSEVWGWYDYAFIEGICASLALWQQINTLNESLWLAQRQGTGARRRAQGLKDRQLQVLALLAEGASNARIAKSLGFSLSTVKADVQLLLELLGAKTRSEAVERAILAGLIPSSSDADSEEPVKK